MIAKYFLAAALVALVSTLAPSRVPAASEPAAPDARFTLPSGFRAATIASIPQARELATLPNGDLLVGTLGRSIYIVPNADAPGAPDEARVFVTLPEAPAAGVAYAPSGTIYASTNTTIWKIAYAPGARTAREPVAIAHVRTGPIAPHSDGDVHRTTSVAATATTLYAGVGSSCNACVEADKTRATIQQMKLDGSGMTTLATRFRNAIALTIDPATGVFWAGGAGQDGLAYGHPYEFFDSPVKHGSARVDYGWPQCEENRHAYNALKSDAAPACGSVVEPAVEFPAYATLIGAAFYPEKADGAYAFPSRYRGGVFVTSHGSWHCCPATTPRVYFVPMHGDAPATPVDWSDPKRQSEDFLSNTGDASAASYVARPTGVAVGNHGSLFVADDQNGAVYRIRPGEK